ncbi:MAG: hypothetical protein M0Z71_03965 [Nitrospiraceae bacterium]|nr:hypothetical protein [Nitrospiraceae bacterium]
MRTISAAGDAVTFMSDEKEIDAISGKVVEIMRGHGYSSVEKLGRKPLTALIIQLECRKWEKGERRLIIEEGIRLLNESISKCLLGQR